MLACMHKTAMCVHRVSVPGEVPHSCIRGRCLQGESLPRNKWDARSKAAHKNNPHVLEKDKNRKGGGKRKR